MTRMITSKNYIEICSELIVAFGKALAMENDCDPSDEGIEANNAAFDLATACGWDWEHDEDFTSWANKATGQESLVEGLQRALAVARAQYLDYIVQQEIRS